MECKAVIRGTGRDPGGFPCLSRMLVAAVEKTGAWLTVQQLTVSGTELGAQEWGDALFL